MIFYCQPEQTKYFLSVMKYFNFIPRNMYLLGFPGLQTKEQRPVVFGFTTIILENLPVCFLDRCVIILNTFFVCSCYCLKYLVSGKVVAVSVYPTTLALWLTIAMDFPGAWCIETFILPWVQFCAESSTWGDSNRW